MGTNVCPIAFVRSASPAKFTVDHLTRTAGKAAAWLANPYRDFLNASTPKQVNFEGLRNIFRDADLVWHRNNVLDLLVGYGISNPDKVDVEFLSFITGRTSQEPEGWGKAHIVKNSNPQKDLFTVSYRLDDSSNPANFWYDPSRLPTDLSEDLGREGSFSEIFNGRSVLEVGADLMMSSRHPIMD